MTKILLLTLLLRIAIALRSSYLHPDEHLQGPGIIAELVFGWASQRPWEFDASNAVRSFAPLYLFYGIPMSFFEYGCNPKYVLYTLRILFMTLTWVLEDMAINRLANTKNEKLRCMLFVSTSYVTLTWQAHTLSNSLETVLLLWFLVILHEAESQNSKMFRVLVNRHYDSFLLGGIFVLGVFNRPTFLMYLAVPLVYLAKLFYKFPGTLLTFGLSVCLACYACVMVDTVLYNSREYVFAPLNFIKYNSSTTNLEAHGLHSRLTHVLVNIPVLLGPGIFMLKPKLELPFLTAVGALACLSLVPHQEARFLLAVVPLLISQMHVSHIKPKLRNLVLKLWLIFNILMSLFMGFFHQAGVLPAQFHISTLERPATVIWWKTYTPPLWVLGADVAEVDYLALSTGNEFNNIQTLLKTPTKNLTVVDLQGAHVDVLQTALHAAVGNVYVVCPVSRNKDVGGELEWKTWFHLDLDQIDFSDIQLGLNILKQ